MILKAALVIILGNIVWWLLVKNKDTKGDDKKDFKKWLKKN